jgi:hypothetical protein
VTPEPQVATSGFARSTPAASKAAAQRLALLVAVVGVEELALRQAQRAGNMAGREPRPRLRFLAGKAGGAARIDDLMVAEPRIWRTNCLSATQAPSSEAGEMGVADLRLAPFHRAPFGFPLLQAAVEDRDIMRAEALQHPPGAGRAVQRAVVVDDEAVAIAEAERLHRLANLCSGGSMCGTGLSLSTISSRSMKTAPGYAPLRIPCGLRGRAGEEHRSVDHPEIGRSKLVCEPFGGYQAFHVYSSGKRRKKLCCCHCGR